MVGLLATVLVASAAAVVTGSGTCPQPAQVSRELDILLSETLGARRPAYRAHVAPAGDGVHIELLNGQGTMLGERDLPREGSCETLGRSVAAVVAAWLGLFEVEAPFGDLRPSAGESHLGRDPPALTVTAGAPAAPPPSAPALGPRPMAVWVTVGVLGSKAGDDAVGGGELAAVVFRPERTWAARVAAFGTGAHTLSTGLEPGMAHWRRTGLEVGPSLMGDRGPWRGEAHAAIAAGVLGAWGTGFDSNESFKTFDLGAAAGLRLARRWGTAAPWVGVEGLYWPGHQQVFVGGAARSAEIPRLDLRLSLGFSVNAGP